MWRWRTLWFVEYSLLHSLAFYPKDVAIALDAQPLGYDIHLSRVGPA